MKEGERERGGREERTDRDAQLLSGLPANYIEPMILYEMLCMCIYQLSSNQAIDPVYSFIVCVHKQYWKEVCDSVFTFVSRS